MVAAPKALKDGKRDPTKVPSPTADWNDQITLPVGPKTHSFAILTSQSSADSSVRLNESDQTYHPNRNLTSYDLISANRPFVFFDLGDAIKRHNPKKQGI
jgi:hypothetical protein